MYCIFSVLFDNMVTLQFAKIYIYIQIYIFFLFGFRMFSPCVFELPQGPLKTKRNLQYSRVNTLLVPSANND